MIAIHTITSLNSTTITAPPAAIANTLKITRNRSVKNRIVNKTIIIPPKYSSHNISCVLREGERKEPLYKDSSLRSTLLLKLLDNIFSSRQHYIIYYEHHDNKGKTIIYETFNVKRHEVIVNVKSINATKKCKRVHY